MKQNKHLTMIEDKIPVPLIWAKKTSSTNDDAKAENREVVVIATKQTKGKGTHGRTFLSPKNKGLYLSMNIYIEHKYEPFITPIVSVITSLTIDKYLPTETKIKWINDIYLKSKKICGILVEKGFLYTIGIGINLYRHKFKVENASSIEDEVSIKVDMNNLIIDLVNDLWNTFNNLNDEMLSDLIDIYKDKSFLIGKHIQFNDGLIYKVIDINDLCHLIIQNEFETKELSTANQFKTID